jgi:hypothetical protein
MNGCGIISSIPHVAYWARFANWSLMAARVKM